MAFAEHIYIQAELQHMASWTLQFVRTPLASFICSQLTATSYSTEEDYRWAILRTKIPKWLFQIFNLVFIGVSSIVAALYLI